MKQLAQNYRSGELALVDVPAPGVGPGEVLVRSVCSLVSTGTELKKIHEAGLSLLGKARARNVADAREQFLDDRAHGCSAEQHRFLAAAAMQEPVGEDVAALEIGGELNFIDGEEGDVDIGGHRLDSADPEARLCRNDFFLAGHQGNLVIADAQAHAVVNFTGEQT